MHLQPIVRPACGLARAGQRRVHVAGPQLSTELVPAAFISHGSSRRRWDPLDQLVVSMGNQSPATDMRVEHLGVRVDQLERVVNLSFARFARFLLIIC